MDAFQVEEIMNSFIDKSVAVQVSNGHKSNSYTVHDLFLDYIRNTQAHNLMVSVCPFSDIQTVCCVHLFSFFHI